MNVQLTVKDVHRMISRFNLDDGPDRSLKRWLDERLYLFSGLSGDEKRQLLWRWKYVCPPGFVVHCSNNRISFTRGLFGRFRSKLFHNHLSWVREFWIRTYLPYIVLLDEDKIESSEGPEIAEIIDWLYNNTRSRWHGREISLGIELCFESDRDALTFYMQYSDCVRASVVSR